MDGRSWPRSARDSGAPRASSPIRHSDPIRGWSKEVGARYDGAGITAQLALFRLDVSHERIQDPVTREVLATGRTLRQGISANVEARLDRVFTLLVDGTVNDATVKSGGGPARRAGGRACPSSSSPAAP